MQTYSGAAPSRADSAMSGAVSPQLPSLTGVGASRGYDLSMALDLGSFGLQNQQLQLALSSMLKAIVSISEDHKVVKQQLEAFEKASRKTHGGIAKDMEELNAKLTTDLVLRNDYTEARYDDQRRTDRVGQALNEFRQEQTDANAALLPRVSNLEARLNSLVESAAVVQGKVTSLEEVRTQISAVEDRVGDLSTLTAQQHSILEQELLSMSSSSAKQFSELRTDLGATRDSLDELRADVVRNTGTIARHGDEASAMREDLIATATQIATDHKSLNEHVSEVQHVLRDEANARYEASQARRKLDEERMLKAENGFLFQCANFDAQLSEHTKLLRSLSSDVETAKMEVAAMNGTLDELQQASDTTVAKVKAQTDDTRAAVLLDLDNVKRQLAQTDKAWRAQADELASDVDRVDREVSAKIRAMEKRKKNEDEALEDTLRATLQAEVAHVTKAAVNKVTEEYEARDTGRHHEAMARIDDVAAKTEELATAAAADREAAAKTASRVDTLAEEAEEDRQVLVKAHDDISWICELFAIDTATVERVATQQQSPARGEQPRPVRELLNKLIRSLPWYMQRLQSPVVLWAPGAGITGSPVASPRSGSPLGPRRVDAQTHPRSAMVSTGVGGGSVATHSVGIEPMPQLVTTSTGVGGATSTHTAGSTANNSFAGADGSAVSIADLYASIASSALARAASPPHAAAASTATYTGTSRPHSPDHRASADATVQSRTLSPRRVPVRGHHTLAASPPSAADGGPPPTPSQPRVADSRPPPLHEPTPPADSKDSSVTTAPDVAPPAPASAAANTPSATKGSGGPQRPPLGVEIADDPKGRGVVVLNVTGNTAADRAGIANNDVIAAVNDEPTPSKAEFVRAYRNTTPYEAFTVEVIAQGRTTAIPQRLTVAW